MCLRGRHSVSVHIPGEGECFSGGSSRSLKDTPGWFADTEGIARGSLYGDRKWGEPIVIGKRRDFQDGIIHELALRSIAGHAEEQRHQAIRPTKPGLAFYPSSMRTYKVPLPLPLDSQPQNTSEYWKSCLCAFRGLPSTASVYETCACGFGLVVCRKDHTAHTWQLGAIASPLRLSLWVPGKPPGRRFGRER